MKQTKMRKILIPVTTLLALIMVFTIGLSACSSEAETVTTTATATATATTTSTATTTATATTTETVKPITLVFSTHEPGQGNYYNGFWKPWIDEVEKRTNGRIQIEAHWNGELAGPPDAWDALVKGTVDISNVHLQNVPGKFPMLDVVGFTTYGLVNQRPSRLVLDLYEKYPEIQAELEECHILYLGSTYWTSLSNTEKQVKTLEDWKGLKTVGVGEWQMMRAEALGAVPQSMGPMDILPSLQTGVTDGGPLGTLVILEDFGWGDFLTQLTHVRLNNIPLLIGMNIDVWNSLPADVQQALDGMMEWTTDLHDSFYVQAEKDLWYLLQDKYGIVMYTPTEAETARWDAIDKPLWDDFAAYLDEKGLPGTALMADYKALEEKYSIPLSEWSPD